jgi:gas vesicle protein
MGKQSNFLAGIVIGAAAGAAIAMLLQSDTGKKLVADLKDAAGKWMSDLEKETDENEAAPQAS